MRICGVELKGGEAIISLLSYEGETFNVPSCRKVSFSVAQSASAEAIREFHFAFHKLMEDYKVDEIVVIEREQRANWLALPPALNLKPQFNSAICQ